MLKVALTSMAMVAGLTTAGFAQDLDRLSTNELVELANQEGSVTVYSFTSRISKVEAAFEAAYPNIDLQGYDISSTEQIARLKAEAAAGIANADVIYISDVPVVLSDPELQAVLEPYVPPRMSDRVPGEFRSPLLAQRLSTKLLMYNEQANPDGSPIENIWQLTTPEWRGRVVMVDPLQRGDYLDLMTEIVLQSDAMAAAYEEQFGTPIELGDAANAGEKFIMDLFANDLILVKSTDDVNAAVGKLGQDNPPVGFTSYSDRRDNEEEGWALQISNETKPSPGIVFPAVLAVSKYARNPAAARLVIDFLMGDDSETGGPGFAPFYVPGDYSTRSDIAAHPDAISLDDLNAWRIQPTATARIRAEVGDLVLTLQ
ncbi:hypothetical protein MXMO3_02419 [Maritalea myrionectae]|uniref:Iron(III) transport system substrate-binding protein n=1 Tax=Maritalea myrionectae TaxID=454601 RepID=A0A2R4MFY8_9HYPH|nr:ABC transporter substrate-binding protein [Maritalea myrionectae]AVX04932.1 hypothetical protein MXMO3_02419 [Maritalea myrionectae]